MKIGVISDTHLSKPNQALYRLNEGIFADVSIVLHAGDLTRLAILEAFSSSGSFLLGRNPSVGIITVDDGVRGKIINI